MSEYIVITENDESDWDDETGAIYHFPNKYLKLIQPGMNVVYYKGRLKNPTYTSKRLSPFPHYFGIGQIGKIWADADTKNFFAKIEGYQLFNKAVLFKNDNGYLELKANGLRYNYFRGNAIRTITPEEYFSITNYTSNGPNELIPSDLDFESAHTTAVPEGKQIQYFVTKYERIKGYRDQAIRIHGYTCKVCDINFKEKYGILGEGFIHIHHVKPLFSLTEEVIPDPKNDLVPVCPNCHAMLHRKRGVVMTVEELKSHISD